MEQGNMSYSKYHQTIKNYMRILGNRKNSIFLGQQVKETDFYGTLCNVPLDKRIEMPIAEEMQMGISIGLAMEGFLPISVYQRCDFLYRAFDQLYNHLTKMRELTGGLYTPKVIIRTTIGNKTPLDPGIQHTQNIVSTLRASLEIPVFICSSVEDVKKTYSYVLNCKESVIIVEKQELYNG